MPLSLYDSRRRALLPFKPLGAGPVGLYVCGVTPYDTGHLGHAFTYLSFDILLRYLRFGGYDVRYVQNLTDVDDDMLRRARELGEDYLALGNRHATTFLSEMAALNWLPPDVYPRATEHIEPMQAMIGRLLERSHAYRAEGHVYFAIDSWPRYGELSGLSRDEMLPLANERGNVPDMPGKRDPLDFVLWQPSASDEPAWPSPWGPGRPGWHVECSAMSTTYLGEQFAIHGGGTDLAFPHHDSEIAQSEGASGRSPFVGWWMHTGMLRLDEAKMSKSLGNLVLVRDLLASWSGDAIRLSLVRHHYRAELEWDEAGLEAATLAVARLRHAVRLAEERDPTGFGRADGAALDPRVVERRAAFLAAMDDDLDTPRAVGELEKLATLTAGSEDPRLVAAAGWTVRDLGSRILGLRLSTGGAGGDGLAGARREAAATRPS